MDELCLNRNANETCESNNVATRYQLQNWQQSADASQPTISPSESNQSKMSLDLSESKETSYSSGIFSPDIFSENEADDLWTKIEDINIYNRKVITKIEKKLKGVPPHPSITISQLTVDQMLQLYEKNLSKFNNGCSDMPSASKSKDCDKSYDSNTANCSYSNNNLAQTNKDDFFGEGQKRRSSCWVGTDEYRDIAMSGKWPDVSACRYYGVHYNCSSYSEEMDCLLSRYLTRYVGSETASSCVLTCSKSPLKKGLRSNIGRSPGKRLSYITKRRIEMCTAKNFKSNFTQSRQVYMDRKKLVNIQINRLQNTQRSPRLKPTPKKGFLRKKTPKSKTPGSAKKKNGSCKKTPNKSLSAKKSTKRALFMSPEAEAKPDDLNQPSSSKLIRSKRILFESPMKEDKNSNQVSDKESNNKKRKLDDSLNNSDNAHRAKLHKSLSFGGDKLEEQHSSMKPITRHASEQFPNKFQQMSSLHNKKLLWAVSEALRAHNIGIKHEQFKLYMASLAKLTRKLAMLPLNARLLSLPGTSTSETLLKIARQHSFSVIRGKSLEEIFQDEQIKQTKSIIKTPLKIYESETGQPNQIYIKNCENAFGSNKNYKPSCGSSTKTVLQDKTINIDNKHTIDAMFDLNQKKNLMIRTSNLLHASRQINFDEVGDNFTR